MTDKDFGGRFKMIRVELGEVSAKSMSLRLGLSENTWRLYETGKGTPSWSTLMKLVELGFSAAWILTGAGSMRGLSPLQTHGPAPGLPADGELMGRLNDALARLYKDEGIRLSEIDKGRVLMEKYTEVIALAAAPDEYETQIPVVIHRHRKALQAQRAEPGTGKRTA